MTTQKYKSLLVIIWALWAFHPCLAIDDVLRTAKRDAILAQITGAVRPKKADFTYFVWCERRWEKRL